MKNNLTKGAIFTAIRTFMQLIDLGIMFLALMIDDNMATPIILIISAVAYLVLAIIPHFFVKNTSFGVNTLANFLAQVIFSIITALLLMIIIMSDTSGAAGWLMFIWMAIPVLLCPIYFFINIIVDLIAFLVFKNKKGGVQQ